MEILRKRYIFAGDVQEVNFRYTTYQKAKNYDVSGWVANLPNGTVEMQIQGSDNDINEILEYLKKEMCLLDKNIFCEELNIIAEKEFHIR